MTHGPNVDELCTHPQLELIRQKCFRHTQVFQQRRRQLLLESKRRLHVDGQTKMHKSPYFMVCISKNRHTCTTQKQYSKHLNMSEGIFTYVITYIDVETLIEIQSRTRTEAEGS